VAFISLAESVDTNTPAGELMFTLISAFAEFERNIIKERIMFGLDRPRRQKKTLGRPKKIVDHQKVREASGLSVREVAEQFGLSKSKVARIVAR
jgi:DNA invertase Pin-like site-specific DNA recombinase